MRFPGIYRVLLAELLGGEAVVELNRRTGVRVAALPAGCSFSLDLRDTALPTCGLRRTWPHVAAAEVAWCFQGHNHVDWLRRHTRVWNDFADPADCANCGGAGCLASHSPDEPCDACRGEGKTYWLDASYGYRWRYKFGRDQLALGLAALRADPSDRRVWISSWDPAVDGLGAEGQKTVPCPVGFTLSSLEGRLNSTLMIRSSDVYMGLPYDVMRHALVMAAAAASLGMKLGHMQVSLAHPHLYETHWQLAGEMLNLAAVEPAIMMPIYPVEEVAMFPDIYVSTFKLYTALFSWPAYNPRSEVVR